MLFQYVVHPKGLDPFQAAKAWHLRIQSCLPWKMVRAQVRTVSGTEPGQDALADAYFHDMVKPPTTPAPI